jgi:glycosyltransferase involved in cell wall biosynthesis
MNVNEPVSRKRLVYISDLERRLYGGGPYAVNWHAFDQLQRRFTATYAGLLTPSPLWVETTVSEIRRRAAHRRGPFSYFSEAALDRNAELAAPHIRDADAIMFRSAAGWSRCRPSVKYFVYLDVVFRTFFFNTFSADDFDSADLDRIWREEAEFLEGAAGVFFDSHWGLEEARRAYGLRGSHYSAPGRGGVIEPPAADTWNAGSRKLVSVALNFRQKGGDLTLAAYKSLKPHYPSLTWHIVGGTPEGDLQSVDGISYEGALRPDVPAERERLRALLADAFLLVHPTREDTSPLVLTEAAYFGCPAVSVNAFAIPELVEHDRTGLLIDPPVTSDAVARAIADLLEDSERYLDMRRQARTTSLEKHSWDRIGTVMCDRIEQSLAG